MTQYVMTERLSEKCNVTLEEAKAALEGADWNMLTATHLLEQESFRRMQQLNEFAMDGTAAAVMAAPEAGAADEAPAATDHVEVQAADTEEAEDRAQAAATEKVEAKRRRGKGLRNLGEHLRRLVACGNRNRFAVHKNGERLLEMPVTALALLMLCAFWVCVPLLVIGLFAGCRYSFQGKELGREGVNAALGRASDAAEAMKQGAARA